jgi:hypothetical protein
MQDLSLNSAFCLTRGPSSVNTVAFSACVLKARVPLRAHSADRGLLGSGSPELVVAVGASETADVKHLLVGQEPFHGVHRLLTLHAALLCRRLKLLEKEADNFSLSTNALVPAEMGLGFNLS